MLEKKPYPGFVISVIINVIEITLAKNSITNFVEQKIKIKILIANGNCINTFAIYYILIALR
ncbi:protein of unknown function [Candidatus Nitrosocosmicus franklandus]|uniref:Uncharacterized protein n=1 Tax=Candidatus Nitrosocosmicus franklandianus TaxID=1798806 RepID=A0A484ICH2_9ARCH|nr:protein of unknown function [Candidatus Nitrosocosmicus franklandus]